MIIIPRSAEYSRGIFGRFRSRRTLSLSSFRDCTFLLLSTSALIDSHFFRISSRVKNIECYLQTSSIVVVPVEYRIVRVHTNGAPTHIQHQSAHCVERINSCQRLANLYNGKESFSPAGFPRRLVSRPGG
jgi:hypothetical protein